MKKLFKWVALCLALMLAFGIAACSKEGEVAQSESAAFIAAVEEIGEVMSVSPARPDPSASSSQQRVTVIPAQAAIRRRSSVYSGAVKPSKSSR